MSKNLQDILMDMNFHQIKNLGAPTDPSDAVRLQDLIAAGSGSYAPTTAKYIIQQPVLALPNAQAISDLPSGILYGTTGTGVISIAAAGTTFVPPSTQVIAGAGLIGGGPLTTNVTIDAVAHPDGSIIVNANNIQVGVINDTQHGARGGGSLHPLATNIVAGFMGPTDKATINNARFFVGSATNAPAGSQNTATLGPGVLKQTVTAGVATIAIATAADLAGSLIFTLGLTRTGDTVTNDVITGRPIGDATWTGTTFTGGQLNIQSSNTGSVLSKGVIQLDSSQLLLASQASSPLPADLTKPMLACTNVPSLGISISDHVVYVLSNNNYWFGAQSGGVGVYNGAYFAVSLGGVSDPAPRMYAEGAAHFAVRNLANPLGLRVYNNIDAGLVNYQRGTFTWVANANNLTIGTEAGGSGTLLPVRFVGAEFNFTNQVRIQTLSGMLKATGGLVTVALAGADYLPGTTTLVAGTNITLVGTLASGSVTINSTGGGGGGEVPLTFVDGLTRVVNTIHGDYITGKPGNQTWTGSTTDGTLPGGTLTIRATGHANKGNMTLDSKRLFVADSTSAISNAAAPPFAFLNNTTVGISADGSGMYFCVGGSYRFQVASSNVSIYQNAYFSMARGGFTEDFRMWGEAGRYMSLRNEGLAQNMRIYNMFNSGTSAYERASLNWDTFPGQFTISTEAGGTGTLRALNFIALQTTFYEPVIVGTSGPMTGCYFTGFPFGVTDKVNWRVGGVSIPASTITTPWNFYTIEGLNTPVGQDVFLTHSHTVAIYPMNFQGPGSLPGADALQSSTLYIGGPPSASGVMRLIDKWALFIDDGIARFDGGAYGSETAVFQVPSDPTGGTFVYAGRIPIIVDGLVKHLYYFDEA